MKDENLIRIEPNLHLNQINIFDIGLNKEYFNKGLIEHEVRTKVTEQLTTVFDAKKDQTIAIPGYVIEQLSKEQPETMEILKNKVQTNNIILTTQPYFGTSLHSLSEEDAIKQITRHQNILKSTFGKSADIVLVDKEPSQDLLEAIHCKKAIVHFNQSSLTEMQQHLLAEMNSLQTHVIKAKDELLIQDLSMLANPSILTTLGVDIEGDFSPYEQYSTMLTILNDVAHRINSAKLSEKAEFQLETEISETPSKLIK